MKPTSNIKARQLSSVPTMHRDSTLRAIGQKAHDLTAEIKSLGVKRDQFQQLMERAPKDGSRLDWIAKQLQA
jgi:hypothetical protein